MSIQDFIEELRNKHGGDLDLENHHYYLFLEDGIFNVYLDADEQSLKADLMLSDGIKVYHTDKKAVDLTKEKPTDGNQ